MADYRHEVIEMGNGEFQVRIIEKRFLRDKVFYLDAEAMVLRKNRSLNASRFPTFEDAMKALKAFHNREDVVKYHEINLDEGKD